MIPSHKSHLRKKLSLKREIAFKKLGNSAGEMLINQFENFFILTSPKIISGYWPIHSELNVLPLCQKLREKGHILTLPRVISPYDVLEFCEWQESTLLVKGMFGTTVPGPEAVILIPEIILVPLLGFDRLGNRLGYGKGHYDRTLESLRKKHSILAVGIGFAAQEIAKVFGESHDEKLDLMITEKEVIDFRKK